MNWKLCGLMAASTWILGAFDGIVDVAATMSFSPIVDPLKKIAQFFCDVPALLHLSCTDTSTFETLIFICCVVMLLLPFVTHHHLLHTCNYNCYSCEFWEVGTRLSPPVLHILLLWGCIHVGSYVLITLRPTSNRSATQDKAVSAFYTILTPR